MSIKQLLMLIALIMGTTQSSNSSQHDSIYVNLDGKICHAWKYPHGLLVDPTPASMLPNGNRQSVQPPMGDHYPVFVVHNGVIFSGSQYPNGLLIVPQPIYLNGIWNKPNQQYLQEPPTDNLSHETSVDSLLEDDSHTPQKKRPREHVWSARKLKKIAPLNDDSDDESQDALPVQKKLTCQK